VPVRKVATVPILLISGGRDYRFNASDCLTLTELHLKHRFALVVHGACPTGADMYGDKWARGDGISIKRYPVTPDDWRTLGLRAGPLRNQMMAEFVRSMPHPLNLAVLFPGGAGTASMERECRRVGLRIRYAR